MCVCVYVYSIRWAVCHFVCVCVYECIDVYICSVIPAIQPFILQGASDFTGIIPIEEIKCSYITKVCPMVM